MTGTLALAVARRLSAWTARLIPAADRVWAEAVRDELDMIEHPGARLAWATGGLAAALRMRAAAAAEGRFDLLCAGLLAALTIFDWRSPDPVPTLIGLAAITGSPTHARPERAWPLGLLFSHWLFLAHWLADWSVELRPFYQHLPLSTRELAEIALMTALALPAAWLGARLGRRPRPA